MVELRKIISTIAMLIAALAFVLMFTVDGGGSFIDLSNIVIYALGVISFLCITIAILDWKSEKDISKKTKGIFLLVVAVVILAGVFLANYDFDGPAVELTINEVLANEPNITGVVTEVYENSILIENETSGEYFVSLNVQMKDSMTQFCKGDEVVVYFDGMIAETYPMQINNVYAIMLITPENS